MPFGNLPDLDRLKFLVSSHPASTLFSKLTGLVYLIPQPHLIPPVFEISSSKIFLIPTVLKTQTHVLSLRLLEEKKKEKKNGVDRKKE